MSVSGLCQICESRPAEHRCDNCGTLACDPHFEPEKGLCADCAARADPGPGQDRDDVDVHRF
ncbi:hypothetical protein CHINAEXTREME_13980 [Halobiforma lacisalsi AJ5]|uniref:HIT-type domain-containing protein n=1 Tax=Natronobacterium lacisalsi AJ5 TaxID=358396 RepID=M0LIQ9_NATLA|nr:hypothetical protein [Halobiforma lacisalsi]APW98823.1 hypothetical protein CHINAEXTREME_13980 [Halobiforma lacisalsi AJ5]EMA32319.1 hypothetical protein C445_11317 [Halobiforma lacisalsi AJ5]